MNKDRVLTKIVIKFKLNNIYEKSTGWLDERLTAVVFIKNYKKLGLNKYRKFVVMSTAEKSNDTYLLDGNFIRKLISPDKTETEQKIFDFVFHKSMRYHNIQEKDVKSLYFFNFCEEFINMPEVVDFISDVISFEITNDYLDTQATINKEKLLKEKNEKIKNSFLRLKAFLKNKKHSFDVMSKEQGEDLNEK